MSLLASSLLLLCALPTPTQREHRLLVLNSYAPNFPTTEPLLEGLREGLGDLEVVLDVEFLYSKAAWSDEYARSTLAMVVERLGHREPYDLVVAMDDHALDLVALDDGRTFARPFVAVGINHPSQFERFAPNTVTGAVELIDVGGTLRLAEQLQGGLERVAFIVDGSHSGDRHLRLVREHLGEDPSVGVLSLAELDVRELHARLAALGPSAAVVVLSAHLSKSVEVSFARAHRSLCDASTAPVYTPFTFALGCGPVGGSVIDMRDHGVLAGRYAARLLRGTPIDELPLVHGTEWRLTVVPGELARWPALAARVPEGTATFPPPGPRPPNGGVRRIAQVLGVVALVGVSGWLVHRSRRKSVAPVPVDEAGLASVGRVATSMAHDLNNLLTVVQAYGRLIDADESLPAATREGARSITAASERAARLTQRVLLWARGKRGERAVLVVQEHLRELVAVLQRVAVKGATLELDLDLDLVAVEVYPVALDQILLNLVANANDAGASSVEVRVSRRSVLDATELEVGRLQPGDWACIEVVDDGEGLEEELAERATEEFFTTRSSEGGTGVGLATVARFCLEEGGGFSIEPNEDRGATASVWLPAVDGAEAERLRAPLHERTRGLRGTANVWVVEHDDAARDLLARNLSKLGYRVRAWSSPADVLAELSNGTPPDALVAGLQLPGLRGDELVRRARAVHAALPAVLTSDAPTQVDLERVTVLRRPFDLVEVLAAVARATHVEPPGPLPADVTLRSAEPGPRADS